MSRPFGWSLPPGAAGDPLAPWNQQERPCEVCGKAIDECICPECPVCGAQGDPWCYLPTCRCEGHGLCRSQEQIASLAAANDYERAARAAEAEATARAYGNPSEDPKD